MIYVDNTFDWPSKGLWCHLFVAHDGDVEELHRFAAKIGLRRSWFQDRQHFPHYDLRPSKRELALRHGAVVLTHPRDKITKCSRRPEFRAKLQGGAE